MDTFYYMGDYYIEFMIISICAYIYLAGIYFTNKRKEREINEQEDQLKIDAEKTRIATEMHDDLGADLSNLLFKLRIYQNRNGNKHLEEYHEIENFTKEIIKKVNETIWTLNSEKDTLVSLSNFMLKFLDDFLGKTNISYQFQREEVLPEIPVLIEKRRNIFHLFKETIKYIVCFEGLSDVSIKLKFEDHHLLILISYECNPAQALKSEQENLLDLMQKRTEVLKTEFINEMSVSDKNKIQFKIEI
jgi:glucose-6-phosphate-specific signal transduction histidine kinase